MYLSESKKRFLERFNTKTIKLWYHKAWYDGYYDYCGDYGMIFTRLELREMLDTRGHVFRKQQGRRLRFLMSKHRMCKDDILKCVKFRNFIFKGECYE